MQRCELDLASFDLIVALDKSVAASLTNVPAHKPQVSSIPDAWIGARPEDYKSCALRIIRELGTLKRSWLGT